MSDLNIGDLNPVARVYEKIHDSLEEWNQEPDISQNLSSLAEQVIHVLNSTPGMTPAHGRDFRRATPLFTLRDGSVLKTWRNPVGVEHVFIVDKQGKMLFGGFVGWIHSENIKQTIEKIRKKFT